MNVRIAHINDAMAQMPAKNVPFLSNGPVQTMGNLAPKCHQPRLLFLGEIMRNGQAHPQGAAKLAVGLR